MNGDFIKDLHFHKIFNHLNDGIFIADQYGYAIWVNETSTKQIGAPRSKIIGKHVDDLESKGFFTPSVTKIVLEKKDVVSKVQTSNGRQFLATGYPVQIKEDNTGYILVHVKDITETVKTTFQLEKAEALIQQYWQELQRMKSAYQQNNEESNIIGQSKKHEKMINMISRLSDVDATILLTGESGVGKSRIAEEIHKRSSRSKKPFLSINCGAIPESLLESELFGYKKGAFSGANQKGKTGLAEMAEGGTLFLDEVAELPLSLQPKLLHLVQDKTFIPIGATEPKKVDIRIIAATNQDLLQMVKEKKFREDLYYRLNVVSIHVPSLRERREDILPLAYHYFNHYKKKYNKQASLSNELIDFFQSYDWPGNIRELENIIERLVITSEGNIIGAEDLPDQMIVNMENRTYSSADLKGKTLKQFLEEIEKRLIKEAMEKYRSTRKAAESLGMTQSSYMRRLKKYNLSKTL